jgi:hypothetical protein
VLEKRQIPIHVVIYQAGVLVPSKRLSGKLLAPASFGQEADYTDKLNYSNLRLLYAPKRSQLRKHDLKVWNDHSVFHLPRRNHLLQAVNDWPTLT